MADEPVHEQLGTDREVEDAAARQRTLTGVLLAHSDSNTVDELVQPGEGEL